MFIPPYRITLSGGGIKGFAHIGALEVLEERGYLKAVREYIGISAGALCAMCLSIGCSLSEMRMIVQLLDFGLLRDLDPETILTFPESFGLDTGENLTKLVVAILRAKKLPPAITFGELAEKKLGPALRIFVTNLNTCRAQEFSAAASPDAEVRFALTASMCIPIYFKPVQHPRTGHYLVDGGVICHSPLKFLNPEEQEHTLSITFDDSHKPKEEIQSLFMFLGQLYYTLDYQYNEELVAGRHYNTIFIDCGAFRSLHFEAEAEEKTRIMDQGRLATEKFLRRCELVHPKPPVRRFSAT
jgi:NTE family protein